MSKTIALAICILAGNTIITWGQERVTVTDRLAVSRHALPAVDASLADGPALEEEVAEVDSFARLSWQAVKSDYALHYSKEKLVHLALWMGASAVLATSEIDRELHEWYERTDTHRMDDTFTNFKHWGEDTHGLISLPVYMGTYFIGKCMGDSIVGRGLERWGSWSFRAMLVGGPQVLILQDLIGSERPTEGDSKWDPLQDNNGVSGHAFTGAIPFIVMGRMNPYKPLRYLLYALSMMPAAARIHREKHYLSQVVLGWGLAYMAVDTVARVDDGNGARKMVWAPYLDGERVGISFAMRF